MENYNELTHTGVKGMKWGVRRYQNKDGTLTNAGKKRYARDAQEKGFKKQDDAGIYYKTTKKNKREDLDVDTKRYVKEDMERTKKLTDAGSHATSELKRANDKAIKDATRKQLDLSEMSDKELRDQINRAFLEKQYNDMFNPPQVSKGREYAGKMLDSAGTALAITSSALGVALAIKELRG